MSITSRINEMSSHIEQAYDELQGLGADLTNVNKNIENISMVLDDIYDSMPQVSGEGTSLTLDDTRVGKIKSTLKGNTSQDGTPTPTSPIPINVVSGDNEINVVGKNYYNINVNYDWVGANTNYTITGNIINVNGKYFVAGLQSVKSNTNYTLSATRQIIQDNNTCGTIRVFTPDKSQMLGEGKTTFSFDTSNNNQVYVLLYAGLSEQGNVNFSNIQLEKGSSASSYLPYSKDTYNIDLPVENLFNYSYSNLKNINRCTTSQVDNGFTLTSTGVSGFAYASLEIDTTLLGKEITISMKSSGKNPSGRLFYHNSSGVLTSAVDDFWTTNNSYTTTLPSTLPSDITGIALVLYISQINNTSGEYATFSDIQIEAGSKADSYTPYGTTPIELCKIGNYQDYFYKDSGKWYLHKEIGKVVLNGNENWQSVSSAVSGTSRFYYDDDNILNPVYINAPLSNMFKSLRWVDIYDQDTTTRNGVACWDDASHQGRLIIRIDNTLANSVSAFKTWLGTNKPIVYYVSANSTNTEITYESLITQLNLLEKAQSKENQTNISQVNNDLPFIISASALKEWQENTSLNSTLSMVNPLSLGNTLNTQENDTQPIEVDNIEPLEEEENEES